MSKMSQLDNALAALSAHSQALQEAVQIIRDLLSTEESTAFSNSPDTTSSPTIPTVLPSPPPAPLTLEEVRNALLEKIKAGFKAEVKALLTAHGAQRLTDIAPSEYPALMQEAEAIGK